MTGKIKNRIGHLSPRYIVNRSRVALYQRTHPDAPWLTPQAIQFLEQWLSPSDQGLEFGSGRSTAWFAKRVSGLTSVEHDRDWYERVKKKLSNAGLVNVEYYFRTVDESNRSLEPDSYSVVATQFADCSLDFVLVDGAVRSACALASLDKIKRGGILIVDNVNWALPSRSLSPASRSEAHGPVSEEWKTFLERVNDWRRIWTSNGVTDTAIYFRSCPPES